MLSWTTDNLERWSRARMEGDVTVVDLGHGRYKLKCDACDFLHANATTMAEHVRGEHPEVWSKEREQV